MMGKIAMLFGLGMALVAIAAGCGGSGETSEAAASIPKAKYEERAAEICVKHEKEKYDQIGAAVKLAQAEGREASDLTTADLEKLTSSTVVPALRKMVEDLKALPPSEKGQAQFEKLVAMREAEVNKIEAEPNLFVEGKALNESNELAGSLGIRNCILNQG